MIQDPKIARLKGNLGKSSIVFVPCVHNGVADSLAKMSTNLCFVGCYILVWLPRPP